MVYILAHNIDRVCAVFSAQQINYRVKLARIFHIIYTYALQFFSGVRAGASLGITQCDGGTHGAMSDYDCNRFARAR